MSHVGQRHTRFLKLGLALLVSERAAVDLGPTAVSGSLSLLTESYCLQRWMYWLTADLYGAAYN